MKVLCLYDPFIHPTFLRMWAFLFCVIWVVIIFLHRLFHVSDADRLQKVYICVCTAEKSVKRAEPPNRLKPVPVRTLSWQKNNKK